jgi:hypothetical protein
MVENIIQRIINSYNLILNKNSSLLIIFIIGLLLSMGVSHPQFFLNDEWITANQLNQLDQGHQVVINEGKYGFSSNGSPNTYFEGRNNALMYPLFLPLISLPALKIIKLFGDTLDYWLMVVWTLLLILLGLIMQRFHPKIAIFRRIPLSALLIAFAFLIFILNLALYLPFTISQSDAPREAAAIILTNDIIFSGLLVVIYCTIKVIFNDTWFTLFGAFICITSSSYLIWVSSAKDHMLEIFLFSLLLFGVVKFFYTKNLAYCYFSYMMVGLIAWERPEIGIFLFSFLFISFLLYCFNEWKKLKSYLKINYFLITLFIAPLFTVLGALPLFLNNYLVTKNPFIPMYVTGLNNNQSENISFISTGSHGFLELLNTYLLAVYSRITPQFSTSGQDLIRFLFLPESGSIGLLIVIPVFLVGLLSFILICRARMKFRPEEKYLLFALCMMSLAIIVSYITSFHILNTDQGVFPDIRYLSPVYLSLNMIGLIIISKFLNKFHGYEELPKYTLIFFGVLMVLFIAIISLLKYLDEDFFLVYSGVSIFTLILVMASVMLALLSIHRTPKDASKNTFLIAVFGFMIAIPLVWQINSVFIIANLVRKFAGYTFFLPIVREIINWIYILI